MRPRDQFHEELREHVIPWHEHRYDNVGTYEDVGEYGNAGKYEDISEYEDVGIYEEIDAFKTRGRRS